MDCPNFFPDNNRLLLRNPIKYDSIIAVYKISDDEIVLYSRNNVRGFSNITLSKDGRYFASGGTHEDISYFYLWDAETMKPIRLLDQGDFSTGLSLQIVFSENSKFVGYAQPSSPLSRAVYFQINEPTFKRTYSKQRICFINEDFIALTDFWGQNKIELRKIKTDELIFISNTILSDMDNYSHDKINYSLLMNTTKGFIALDLNKILTTSVPDPQTSPELKITYQKGILSVEADFIHPVSISIVDMTGKVIQKLDSPVSNSELRIPLKLPNGTYLIYIQDGSKEYTSKFLVVE